LSPSFVDCRRWRRTTPPLPATASLQQLHGLLPSLITFFSHHIQRNRTTVRKKQELYCFIYGTTFRKTSPDSQIW
jgi:hypothetical protein